MAGSIGWEETTCREQSAEECLELLLCWQPAALGD